jgi:hypothetical protein
MGERKREYRSMAGARVTAVDGRAAQTSRKWSEADLAVLRAQYAELGPSRLAAVLGRPAAAVRNKAYLLKLTQPRPWTAEEDAELRRWLGDTTLQAPGFERRLATHLGRSLAAVSVRISRLGLGEPNRTVPTQFRAPVRKPKYATAAERTTALSEQRRRHIAEHGHPRGYLGHKHSDETRAKLSARVRAGWANPESGHNQPLYRAGLSDRFSRMAAERVANTTGGNVYSRARRGYRDDLSKVFFRSRWEANYARYLNLLIQQGQVVEWAYECETFWFEAIRRGVRSYTPDFRVVLPDGSHEWHEVKGWMDAKSKTKLQRMKKYYPHERVVLIEEPFFKQIVKSGLAGAIPFWEFKRAH